jgi:hypothetical protein
MTAAQLMQAGMHKRQPKLASCHSPAQTVAPHHTDRVWWPLTNCQGAALQGTKMLWGINEHA